MNRNSRRATPALQVLMLLFSIAFGAAHAADSPEAAVAPVASSARSLPRAPLDLRVPDLRRVMSRSQLLAEMGSASDDEESIEVVAAPALVPMSFDAEAPLGIVDSLRWSVDHPTQMWRIVLPATVTP
jgi:hypothetical protein